jgi:hypothetical protein
VSDHTRRVARSAALAVLIAWHAPVTAGVNHFAPVVAAAPAGTGDAPTPVEADRMRVPRETLTRVLAQPEFQRGPAALWAEDLRRRITRWIVDLFERMGMRSGTGGFVATALAWSVGIAALCALAWWLVGRLVGTSRPGGFGFDPAPSQRRSSRWWARAAVDAHTSGDTRQAARCAFRSAVARLEEDGVWRTDDSRTPREYLRLVAPSHRHRPILLDIVTRFELAWYGAARPSPDDGRLLLARLKELGCLAPDQAI